MKNQLITLFRKKQVKKAQIEENYVRLGDRLFLMKEHFTVHLIDAERICPSPFNESALEEGSIQQLCDSIRRYGLLEPLSVRRVCSDSSSFGGMFVLIAGKKRFAALKILGIREIPCVICELPASASLFASASAKIHTSLLNIFDKGALISQIRDEYCLSYEEIAHKLSIPKSAVRIALSSLAMDAEERGICLNLGLSDSVIEKLLKMPNGKTRKALLREATSLFFLDKNEKNPFSCDNPLGRRLLFNDMRVLYNSVEKMVQTVRSAGVGASWFKKEVEDAYEIRITVPKRTYQSVTDGTSEPFPFVKTKEHPVISENSPLSHPENSESPDKTRFFDKENTASEQQNVIAESEPEQIHMFDAHSTANANNSTALPFTDRFHSIDSRWHSETEDGFDRTFEKIGGIRNRNTAVSASDPDSSDKKEGLLHENEPSYPKKEKVSLFTSLESPEDVSKIKKEPKISFKNDVSYKDMKNDKKTKNQAFSETQDEDISAFDRLISRIQSKKI